MVDPLPVEGGIRELLSFVVFFSRSTQNSANRKPKTAAIKKCKIFHTSKLETYASFLIAL